MTTKNKTTKATTTTTTTPHSPPPNPPSSLPPYLLTRLKISLFAIALTWLTSLRIGTYLSSLLIPTPSPSLIQSSCSSAYAIVTDEKELFSSCARSQLSTCRRSWHHATMRMEWNERKIKERNELALLRAKRRVSECTSGWESLRRSLFGYSSLTSSSSSSSTTTTTPIQFLSTCTNTPRASQLSGSAHYHDERIARHVQSDAFEAVESYSSDSQRALSRVVDYAVERGAYDQWYWGEYVKTLTEEVYNKLQGLVSSSSSLIGPMEWDWDDVRREIHGLLSCVTPRSERRGLCDWEGGESVRRRLEGLREEMERRMEVYRGELRVWWGKVNEYKGNAWTAYQNAKRFYEKTHDVVTKIPLWEEMPGLRNLFTTSPNSFLAVDVDFPRSLPSFSTDLPTIESIWSGVEPVVDQTMDRLTALFDDMELQYLNVTEEIRKRIGDVPRLLPEDYDPPRYIGGDVAMEKRMHGDKTKVFIQQSAVTLNTLSSLISSSTSTTPLSYNTTTPLFPPNIPPQPPSPPLTLSNITLLFQNFTNAPPDLNIQIWFFQFASLGQILYLLDFALRTYTSLRLLYRFGSAGTLRLPEIDVRMYDKRQWNPLKMSPARLVFAAVSSPLTGLALIGLVVSYCVTLGSGVYLPIYQDYVRGCVTAAGGGGVNSNASSASFVAENLFSLAYNHAAREGNEILLQGLDDFDRTRVEYCAKNEPLSRRMRQEEMIQMEALKQTFQTTSDDMELLRQCIDIDAIDEVYESVCCGWDGYDDCPAGGEESERSSERHCPLDELSGTATTSSRPLRRPGDILQQHSTCSSSQQQQHDDDDDESIFTLDDTRLIDCSTLPSCPLSCRGPFQKKIQTTTRDCACHVEYFIHATWLQFAVALLIYASMNVSRVGLLEGLVRVNWRKLHPELFTVKGTVRRDGRFVVPAGGKAKRSEEDDGGAMGRMRRAKKKREDEDDGTLFGFLTRHWESTATAMTTASDDDGDDSDVKNDDEAETDTMSGIVRERLETEIIPRFECVGYIILIGAILINIPWIYGLIVMTHDIRPRSSSWEFSS